MEWWSDGTMVRRRVTPCAPSPQTDRVPSGNAGRAPSDARPGHHSMTPTLQYSNTPALHSSEDEDENENENEDDAVPSARGL